MGAHGAIDLIKSDIRLTLTVAEYNLNNGKYEFNQITDSTLSHFYEKLLLLKDKLHTKTALNMAEQRHKFMLLFLDEFYKEI